MNEDIKCTCASATPINVMADQDLQRTLQNTAQAVQQSLDSFSDKVPPTSDEISKAKGFLNNFTQYIKGEKFKSDVNATAVKYGVPPKTLATNFFEKALGTIGDILGVAISTVGNVGHTLVNLLAIIAHGAVNIICKIASGLARLVTLNKTCVATA